MRLKVFISEIETRNGVKDNKPWEMTIASCVDLSPAPAMRLKHMLQVSVPKDQMHIVPTLKESTIEVDIYELSENRGNIEARGVFVLPTSKPAAAPAQPPRA